MKRYNFIFRPDKYDYWKIYETIIKYFPIGFDARDTELYKSYPGQKKLGEIIVENIHDGVNYKSRWKWFEEHVTKSIGKNVRGTTYGQAASVSAEVYLEHFEYENFIRIKALSYYISLIGPFYSIIGEDRNEIKVLNKKYPLSKTNYLVVSPEAEFADGFNWLCENIEKSFPGYRFVPYSICNSSIEGLNIEGSCNEPTRIFDVLFAYWTDLNTQVLGDIHFREEQWIKEDYVDDGSYWVAYPPPDFQ